MTPGCNKGPSERLENWGKWGKGFRAAEAITCLCPIPPERLSPSTLEEMAQVALSGRSSAPGTVLTGLGFRGTVACELQLPPSPRPSPAPPQRAGAVFPIKAGIPGWAQTKRDRGKSTPRASQTLTSLHARLGSQRRLLIYPAQARPCVVSSRKGRGWELSVPK